MGMKASEVGDWLRQRAGKRDHREVLSDDVVVIRPGPNFDWFMGNLGADQPAPRAPMPEPTYPAVIDTPGRLIDHGMGAFRLCRPCLRADRPDVRDIDLNRLAGHLGRDWNFINRCWPVKCAVYGERNVEVRITVPAPPHPDVQ